MLLTAVTRLLNEEDIVESFVRHHAAFVQSHIFLDNGSSDRSLDILAALQREGFRLAVYQNTSPVFVEPIFNTALFDLAAADESADWIMFLDCDEFVDDRRTVAGLHPALESVAEAVTSVRVPMVTYVAATDASAPALNCMDRLVLRRVTEAVTYKVIVRRPRGARVAVGAGAHFSFLNGQQVDSPVLHGVCLAHYPERSTAQVARKVILGWLKVLATGKEGANARWSEQYRPAFEALRDDPAGWLEGASKSFAWRALYPALVLDPAPYRGGLLTHTTVEDAQQQALMAILRYAERLALAHGRLMDELPEAGGLVIREAWRFVRVL